MEMRFFNASVPLISGDDTDDRLECGGGLFDVVLKADMHISRLVASALFKHILPQTKYPSQLLQLVTASPGLLDFAFFHSFFMTLFCQLVNLWQGLLELEHMAQTHSPTA